MAPGSCQQGLLLESPGPNWGGRLFHWDCLDVCVWAFDWLCVVHWRNG